MHNRVCISLIFLCALIFLQPLRIKEHAVTASDNFVQNPRKGNRMLVGKQNHPNPLLTTGKKILCQKAMKNDLNGKDKDQDQNRLEQYKNKD